MRINGFTWSLAVACLFGLYSFNMQPTNALYCFSCSNCGDSVGKIIQCSDSEDACMKFDFEENMRLCTPKILCDPKSVDSFLKDIWSIMPFSIGDIPKDVTGPIQDAIHCCETNFCNSAPSFAATSTLLIISIAALKFLF